MIMGLTTASDGAVVFFYEINIFFWQFQNNLLSLLPNLIVSELTIVFYSTAKQLFITNIKYYHYEKNHFTKNNALAMRPHSRQFEFVGRRCVGCN